MQQEQTSTVLRRRKGALLASVFALGLGGLVAGEALLGDTGPAQAQVTQAQDLSKQNSLQQNAPRQDQIGFADIVETVKPAVVSVRVKTRVETSALEGQMPGFFRDLPEGHPLRRFFDEYGMPGEGQGEGRPGRRGGPRGGGQAQGSGFFITADGFVVTNNHVVENATEVELVTDGGDTLQAKVVGTDPQTDLALLKVDKGNNFPFVSFGSTPPRVGDWVVAIGNPFGLSSTVTAGIVSARGRDIGSGPYDDFLQIDAAVNRGNSGGPTFNLKGEVVGVNTAIFSQSGGNIGIAFAVSSDVAARVVQDLRESGSVTRGWLGVGIQKLDEEMAEALGVKEASGALVSEVRPGTPAAKAGLETQDVITSVNGQKIADPRELTRFIAGLKPGSKAEVTLWRKGAERNVTVDLGTRPNDLAQAGASGGEQGPNGGKASPSVLGDLGLQLGVSPDGGVAVTGVDSGSPLAEKLREGDIILEVAGTEVSSPSDVAGQIEAAREKGSPRFLTLRVRSGENARFVAIPVQKG